LQARPSTIETHRSVPVGLAPVIAVLRKYGFVFQTGLQSALVYRWNFLLRGMFSLVHLTVVFILWGAAYAGQETIGGFDVRQTMTYFVVTLALQFLVGAFNEDYQISEEIRNGLINQFLLKPIDYFAYRVSLFGAARIVSGVLVLVPLAVAYPFIDDYLVLPEGEWRLWLGVPALLLAALLQFTIAFCFGMLTFWFLEIHGFVILSYAIETLLGGQIFPLDLLPAPFFAISQMLPFAYQMYFPAAILAGRIEYEAALTGLAVQTCWVIVLMVLARFLWQRGLRRHTAVGG
jgi:ABC-2 type transport system permease protein